MIESIKKTSDGDYTKRLVGEKYQAYKIEFTDKEPKTILFSEELDLNEPDNIKIFINLIYR